MMKKLKALFQGRKNDAVMGYRIAEPRPTLLAAFWAMIYLGLPVLLLGMLLDLLLQLITGCCSGFWCFI